MSHDPRTVPKPNLVVSVHSDLTEAIGIIEQAITVCKKHPGVLARPDFVNAVSLIRAESQGEWFRLRAKLKDEKPSGVLLGDIEKATKPDGDHEDESSVADPLVALVREQGELYHAQDGTCYVTTTGDGPRKTLKLGTKSFTEWLGYSYFTATVTALRSGRAAGENAIRKALTVLTGLATHEGPTLRVFQRAAKLDHHYFLDLGSDDWGAIEITGDGWRPVAHPAVRFWRSGTTRALPNPIANGDLSLLWNYANIPEADRPLVLAWMLDALRPETPFAVLELTGQQSTAKSATQAKLRRCIDPNAIDLRAMPKSIDDLAVSAGANWCCSLNNLSHLSAPMQDALCTLATGERFASRTLYRNADETLIDAKRPVVMNGIVPLVTAQDLTDRVIHIELPELESYRTESVIDSEFERDAPAIVGGFLDPFVRTLATLPDVQLDRPPRMADCALLGEAMMRAQGCPPGKFLDTYKANRRDSIARSLESSPVARAIRRLVDEYQGRSLLIWSGTMGGLLDALSHLRDGAEAWPKSARGLGDALRRQRPALAQIGIEIDIGTAGRAGVPVRISRREHREHRERDSASTLPMKKISGNVMVL